MALIFTDGFDQYGVTADLDDTWIRSGYETFDATGGRFGGGSLEMDDHTNDETRHFFRDLVVDVGSTPIHAAFWHTDITAKPVQVNNERQIFAFARSTNAEYIRLYETASGALSMSQSNGTGFLTSWMSLPVMRHDHWHHIEIKFYAHDTNGIAQVWVDGGLVINQVNVDTRNGGTTTNYDEIQFWTHEESANPAQAYYDDIVVWDETGADFAYTGPIGEHRIETLYPNDDGAVQFTSNDSGGFNFNYVDDVGIHDGDTTYVESSTIGHLDRYGFSNQVSVPASTLAVAVHSQSKKTDVGSMSLRNVLYVNGTLVEGKDRWLNDAYSHHVDYWGFNPDTSTNWGNTDVNSIQAGFKYQE